MSGICGVYNSGRYTDNLIQTLLEGNTYRGKDKIRTLVDDNIAFGFAGLCVTKESIEEVQPIEIDGVTLVADLHLERRKVLINNLEMKGIPASVTEPDILLFYKAFKAWDINLFNELDGEFSFAIWDSKLRRLICGRDHLGLRPFYYKWDGNQFIFSSTLEALLATCSKTPDWDKNYFFRYIVDEGVADGEQTPYQGINRLPAGTCLVIKDNQLMLHKYWDLREVKDIKLGSNNEYCEYFRRLFFQSVSDKMRAHGPVAVSMSGGLDSTSIFSTGCYLNPSITRDQFFPVTLVFDQYQESDERHFIKFVSDKYTISPYWVIGDDQWSFKNYPMDSPYTAEPFVNSATYFIHSSPYRKAKEMGAKVMLSGAGGDEVLSGSNKVIADYVWNMRWYRALKEVSELARIRQEPLLKNLVQYGIFPLFEKNQAPSWLSREIYEEIVSARPAQGRIARTRQEQQILQLPNRYIDQHVTAPIGMESRHPFLSRRLVEFLIGIPMEQKLKGSIKKLILRRSMQGILPEPIRTRIDKTMHHSVIYLGIQKEWPNLAKAFNKGYLAQLGLIDQAGFKQDLDLWKQGDTRQVNRLWTIASLEIWFYRQEVGKVSSNRLYAASSCASK